MRKISFLSTIIIFFLLISVWSLSAPKSVFAQCTTQGQSCISDGSAKSNCGNGCRCGNASRCEEPPPLIVGCVAIPNPAPVNTQVRWSYIFISGTWDSGTWTYTGDDGLNAVTSAASPYTYKIYSSPGTKNAHLEVVTNIPQTASTNCQAIITTSAPTATPTAPGGTGTPPSITAGICGIGENDLAKFVSKLFGCGISIVGGIALLFIIYGGFVLLTSAGDPTRVNMGKEYITYAVIGLAMAIFTLVLINIIGGNILNLPGFNN